MGIKEFFTGEALQKYQEYREEKQRAKAIARIENQKQREVHSIEERNVNQRISSGLRQQREIENARIRSERQIQDRIYEQNENASRRQSEGYPEYKRQQLKQNKYNLVKKAIMVPDKYIQKALYKKENLRNQEGEIIYNSQGEPLTRKVIRRGGSKFIRNEIREMAPERYSGRFSKQSASPNNYSGSSKYASRGRRGSMGRGRPRGSYKYIIPGKGAISVFEYRKWARYQNRMRIMQRQQEIAQVAKSNPQLAQQMAENPQFDTRQANMPQQQYNQEQRAYSQPMPQQNNPYTFGQASQSQGLPMMGSMNLLSMKMNQGVVQAPVNSVGDPNQTPITNPSGDYYTEPDFFSGKQVLRRRSSDRLFKW
jgi:hypothetical protein